MPGLRFRPASIRPHLSSHCSSLVLYCSFHGSSNASNLDIPLELNVTKLPATNEAYQKYSVPLDIAWQTQSDMNLFISSTPATEPSVLLLQLSWP